MVTFFIVACGVMSAVLLFVGVLVPSSPYVLFFGLVIGSISAIWALMAKHAALKLQGDALRTECLVSTETQEDGRRFANGQCSGCIDQHLFSAKLAALGLAVQEGKYSINVSEFECLTFEFEWDTDDRATIEGTAATDVVLRANAYRLHEVLTLGGVRHWIEITDEVQNPLEYLHHRWPAEV
ncbi:hypothetical protein ABL840_18280 [Variovorax sp. NFACC27]|uniref:hypothetical protein n=1 Tax=unclassified Variovorax TaxID=663243 RepID=UPI000B8A506A